MSSSRHRGVQFRECKVLVAVLAASGGGYGGKIGGECFLTDATCHGIEVTEGMVGRRSSDEAVKVHDQSSSASAILLGSLTTVVCSLPTFLTGAMSVYLTSDLGIGQVGLGIAFGTYFGVRALSAVHLGRLTDRIGAIATLRLAAIGATIAGAGISLFVRSLAGLVGFLTVSGLAASLAEPAANRLLLFRIQTSRLATAFGIKQSAPPTSSLLAGLMVPAIAITLGWRTGFAFVAAVAACVAIALIVSEIATPATRVSRQFRSQRLRGRATLVIIAVSFGISFATSSSLLAFFVSSAVSVGLSESAAGLALSAASLAAIIARGVCGIAVDSTRIPPLVLIGGLLLLGSVGFGIMLLGAPIPFAIGGLLALAGTWGFPGILWYFIVRSYPEAPGGVTGAVAPASLGGVVGPLCFGILLSETSPATGWALALTLTLIAFVGLMYGGYRLSTAHREKEAL